VRLNAPLRANQLDRFTASRVPATNLSRTALSTQLQIKFFLVFREGPRNYQATEKNCDANGGLSFVVLLSLLIRAVSISKNVNYWPTKLVSIIGFRLWTERVKWHSLIYEQSH
jgi:hypothetical protein